mgnify:CR=1 FL=1
MYRYTLVDKTLVRQRVEQFRHQLHRHLAGELDDEEFRPLRLMNGLYLQRHAPMLRVAIPYGSLSGAQLRALAAIARRYDRGFGHFTTRQNIQFNWIALEDTAEVLAELAEADMHAIQTSGNCIRNITCDPLAGVQADEIDDPRPYCELLRQWATLHPEFSYLPRKFKIAVSASDADRVALRFHDIGLRLCQRGGERGFEVWVGGGLGRTPIVGQRLREWLPQAELLRCLDAILRVYNLYGRRDNKYRARIKILVQQMGLERFREQVEAEFADNDRPELRVDVSRVDALRGRFLRPDYSAAAGSEGPGVLAEPGSAYARWLERCVDGHRLAQYAVVHVSLKAPGRAPGDIDAAAMEQLADLAERYSSGELRSTVRQNLLLPHVARRDLPALWRALDAAGLASPATGTASDMVVCPGLDYCSLANAGSIPLAAEIDACLAPLLAARPDLGDVRIHISGCMNACAHHHIGDIGILGVDKKGREFYQISLGGVADGEGARSGTIAGPALPRAQVPARIQQLLERYLALRRADEPFAAAVARLGIDRFRGEQRERAA